MNDDIVPSLNNKAQLAKLVGVVHQNNVKAPLSIRGWLGSISMSKMASTNENRAQFIKKVVRLGVRIWLGGKLNTVRIWLY
jgi:GH18 family chitinase